MVRKCPPGILCIENYTLLFFVLLIIAILYFMNIKYNQNLNKTYNSNNSHNSHNSHIVIIVIIVIIIHLNYYHF
jgi:heme/copper-type cytochrome/quinol oxidase subunit 2